MSLRGAMVFRHSEAPCDQKCLVSMTETAVQSKDVAFVHAMTDAIPLRPLVTFTILMVAVSGLAIMLRYLMGVDFVVPAVITCSVLFFVRLVVWFCLRASLVVVGVPMVNLEKTWVASSFANGAQQVSLAFANLTAQCFGEHNAASIERWTHTNMALFCIPSGSDTCEVGHRQVQVQKRHTAVGAW